MIDPDAVKKLARHFRDPDVGAVCGRLRLYNPTLQGLRGERVLDVRELHQVLRGKARRGAGRERRALRHPPRRSSTALPPDTIVDDFVIPMRILAVRLPGALRPRGRGVRGNHRGLREGGLAARAHRRGQLPEPAAASGRSCRRGRASRASRSGATSSCAGRRRSGWRWRWSPTSRCCTTAGRVALLAFSSGSTAWRFAGRQRLVQRGGSGAWPRWRTTSRA